jgi:hypothetical protein
MSSALSTCFSRSGSFASSRASSSFSALVSAEFFPVVAVDSSIARFVFSIWSLLSACSFFSFVSVFFRSSCWRSFSLTILVCALILPCSSWTFAFRASSALPNSFAFVDARLSTAPSWSAPPPSFAAGSWNCQL